MNRPIVSIIMNCFNSERYLKEAIDSVYAQTFDNWEIIFWDNASTDSSPDIVKNYDDRLRYFRGEATIPLGAARNKALEQARGEYVAFLDCDDIWLEDKLEKQLAYFEDHPECGFLYSNAYVIKNGKKSLAHSRRTVMPEGRVFGSFLIWYPVNLQTVMIRKYLIEELDNWFDPALEIGEEFDIFMRMLYRTEAGYLQEPLAAYRLHAGMDTVKKFYKIMDERLYILNKLLKEFPEFSEKYKKEIQLYRAGAATVQAMEYMLQKRRCDARKVLKPYVSVSVKHFLVYAMTYLPVFLYVLIYEFNGGIILRQRLRYLRNKDSAA